MNQTNTSETFGNINAYQPTESTGMPNGGIYAQPHPQPCPSCGRCPTCGRGGYFTQPYPYPYYPYYPQPYPNYPWTVQTWY